MGRNKSDLLFFIVKRLILLVPILVGLVTVTFVFTHMTTANPCAIWVKPQASQATKDQCVAYFGVNQPLWNQYATYMTNLVHGDWSKDPSTGTPVLPVILSAFPASLELLIAALALMIVVGIPLGVIAANSNGRWADHFVRIFYLSGWATPAYLGSVVLAIAIGPLFGLPTKGNFTSTPPPGWEITHISVLDAILHLDLTALGDAIVHLLLPATALAFLNMGIATRMTRSSMLEVLPLDYVKTARMKGLSDFWVLYKHALRNSLTTTITVLGTTAGTLLSWIVVVESIFQWPGIGAYSFDSITNYNFPGVTGVVIFLALVVVAANLIADVMYGVLDPRVEWR